MHTLQKQSGVSDDCDDQKRKACIPPFFFFFLVLGIFLGSCDAVPGCGTADYYSLGQLFEKARTDVLLLSSLPLERVWFSRVLFVSLIYVYIYIYMCVACML